MASEKIKYSDLIMEDAIPRLISDLKRVEEVMLDIAKSAKGIVIEGAKMAQSRPMEGYENLSAIQGELDKVTKAVETLRTAETKRTAAMTEREKLEKKLAELRTDEAKDLARLRNEIALETKALKNAANERQILAKQEAIAIKEAKKQEAKAVTDANKQITAAKKEAEKQAIKAAKELEKAKIEQQKQDARAQKDAEELKNKYKQLTKETNEAQNEFKKLAAQHGVNSKEAQEAFKKFDALDKKLREVNDAARDGRRDIGRYKIAVEGLNKSLSMLEKIGIVSVLLQLVQVFQQNSTGGAAFEKVVGRITVTLAVFVNRLVKLLPIAQSTFTSFTNSIQIGIKNIQLFVAELPEMFGGSAEKVAELTAQIKALEAENKGLAVGGISDVTKAFEGMGDEIAKLIAKNDALIDATRKYREAAMASKQTEADLLKEREILASQMEDDTQSMADMATAATKLSEVEEKLATLRLKRANDEYKLALEAAAVRVGDLSAREEATEKYIALKEAEAEAEAVQLKIGMERRKIERDQDEQDLDFLIDVADRRKMVGEQQVADESLTFEQRKAAFDAYQKDMEATFREQIAVIERAKGIKIDIDEILSIRDTRELNRRMRELGLSEIITNRGKEVIVERTQAVEDLRKTTLDLLKAQEKQRASEMDIALQDAAIVELSKAGADLNKILEWLAEKRTQIEIENLQTRLALATDGSQQALDIQQELNDKLLAQAQAQKTKELEIEKQKQEQRKELAENTGEFLINLSKEISERRVADIDAALEASAGREAELLELATKGSEDAVQALAFERQKQAELALQREKEIQAQARRELALAGAKIFSAKVAGGIPAGQALAQTGAELLALQEIVKALPAFYEGSERVADDLPATIAGRDGHLARLDGGERVIPTALNNTIPRSMSNMELAMLPKLAEKPKASLDTDLLGKKLDNIQRAIQQQPVLTERVFDADRQALISTTKRGAALERRHKRLSING